MAKRACELMPAVQTNVLVGTVVRDGGDFTVRMEFYLLLDEFALRVGPEHFDRTHTLNELRERCHAMFSMTVAAS